MPKISSLQTKPHSPAFPFHTTSHLSTYPDPIKWDLASLNILLETSDDSQATASKPYQSFLDFPMPLVQFPSHLLPSSLQFSQGAQNLHSSFNKPIPYLVTSQGHLTMTATHNRTSFLSSVRISFLQWNFLLGRACVSSLTCLTPAL